MVLIISMMTILRVEGFSNDASVSQLQARQNALVGMKLAIGELQESMGPDQRVSATAEILTAGHDSKVNTVGVWASADVSSTNLSQSRGDLINWLSSDAKDEDGALINGYHENASPSLDDDNTAVLLGPGTLENTSSSNPQEPVILSLAETEIERDGATVGRYAWWIGDEGVKARINLEFDTEDFSGNDLKLAEVQAISAFPINQVSMFAGLSAIDSNIETSRINTLTDIKLLTGNSQDVDKFYFSDLTTVASGVIADVKNGGLKKDLSLAFEMDDSDFNLSEFAGNGPDAYRPWDTAPFDVQPVFMLENSTGTDAHGPAWHVLRDYYTIYHRMEKPMSNPNFQAQFLGPNLNHSELTYHQPSAAGDEGNRQPALLLAGGLGNLPGSPAYTQGLEETYSGDDVIANHIGYSFGNLFFDGAQYDPLRSRQSSALVPIPTLVKSNYTPFMSRSVAEQGVWFRQENFTNRAGVEVSGRQAYSSLRVTNVFHNPYNVTINHDEMSFQTRGLGVMINAYEGPEPSTTIIEGIPEPDDVDNNGNPVDPFMEDVGTGTLSRSAFAAGSIAPGSFKSYNVRHLRRLWTAGEIVDGEYPNWAGSQKANAAQEGNRIGPRFDTGINSLTITVRPTTSQRSNMNEELMSNGTPASKVKRYSRMTPTFVLMTRGNGSGLSNDSDLGQIDDWPIAYSVSSVVLGPGPSYGETPGGETITDIYRYPVNDLNFYNPSDDPTEYHYSFGYDGINPEDFDDIDKSLALMRYDFQLRPSQFVTQNGEEIRYPVYTMTNPLAPVKDNRALFPSGQLAQNGPVGLQTYAPSWELEVKEPTLIAGDYANWGPSDGSPGAGLNSVVSLELPTAPILSLGKLQFANITIYDHMPALAISNSFASPYIALEQTYALFNNQLGHERIYYDISYLMNEALWDSYFFSSYSIPYDAGSDDFDENNSSVLETFQNAFDSNDPIPLPNQRLKLELGENETIETVQAKLFSGDDPRFESSTPGSTGNHGYRRAAENLLMEGAFNINSMSKEAWIAVLSGARDKQVYLSASSSAESLDSDSTPFLSIAQPTKPQLSSGNISDDNAWGGFRALSDSEIDKLAESIVAEIRARVNDLATPTPFLTLSEFLNRRLDSGDYGLAGVLQAAIDATPELNRNLFDSVGTNNVPQGSVSTFPHPVNLQRADSSTMSAANAASTYLLQADILQSIGSFITTRSDTFRIRSYGEHLNPEDGEVQSQAWCEAIVQRIPEPVNPRLGTTSDSANYWSGTELNGDPTP
ncbi:MAG: hypothetical protein AAF212_03695, partial [Verrucomicrobiota bacterium]